MINLWFFKDNIPSMFTSLSEKNLDKFLANSTDKVVLLSSKSTATPLFKAIARDFQKGFSFGCVITMLHRLQLLMVTRFSAKPSKTIMQKFNLESNSLPALVCILVICWVDYSFYLFR